MAIRIITDSASDMERADALALGVHVVPLKVQFGETTYLDGETITKPEFYTLLLEGEVSPTTSQPTPEDFLTLFEAAQEAGDQVVAVLLSSSLSGTVQSAVIAKGMCGYDGIHIVDSFSATLGEQLLVRHACKLRDQGCSAREIADALDELKSRIRIYAVIDTLEYLRRGGRLSNLQASIGTVTRLKPVITLREGKVVVAGKGFGTAAAVKQAMKFIAESPADPAYPAFSVYSDDQRSEEQLLPKLAEAGLLPENLLHGSLGATIGTHVGPGAMGLIYIAQ